MGGEVGIVSLTCDLMQTEKYFTFSCQYSFSCGFKAQPGPLDRIHDIVATLVFALIEILLSISTVLQDSKHVTTEGH